MAVYFTNFSEYTTGQAPSDWTSIWTGSSTVTHTVESGGSYGSKVLRSVITSAGWTLLEWDDVATTGDFDILCRIKTSAADGYSIGPACRTGGAGSTATNFVADIASLDAAPTTYLDTWTKESGQAGSTNHNKYAYTIATDTWYWVRFRRQSNSMRARIWTGAPEDEPTSWHVDATVTANATTGKAGIFTYGVATCECDYFAVATGGSVAPYPPLEPSGVTVSVTGAQPTVTATANATVSPGGGAISCSGAQPTVQFTYSEDFSAHTVDQQPTTWTEQWHTTVAVALTKAVGQYGGKSLWMYHTSNNRYAVSCDDLGNALADVDILVKFRVEDSADGMARVYARGSGTDSSETGFFIDIHSDSNEMELWHYINNNAYQIGSAYGVTINLSTEYWMRLSAVGAAGSVSLKAKIWAYGTTEPAWQIEQVSTANIGSGWVGVGSYKGSVSGGLYVDWFAVGTNGASAPFPNYVATPAGVAVAVTGAQPTVTASINALVSPAGVDVTVAGAQPTVTATTNVTVNPAGVVVSVVGAQPTVVAEAGVTVNPGAGTITVTGAQPTVVTTANVTVNPTGVAIVVSGAQPVVSADANVTALPGACVVSVDGAQPTVIATANVVIQPSGVAVSVTGAQPTVTGSSDVTVTPSAGTITVSGAQPTVTVVANVNVQPAGAEIAVSGAQPTITSTASTVIKPGGATITVTGAYPIINGLRAFPGAVGHGAYAVGGRGGTIYRVNTLADNNNTPVAVGDGTYRCSLRAACNQSGPRIVVFEVSGYIDLTTNINISNPYITIAGETAPSPGICLRQACIAIGASHVIMRHIASRPGDSTAGQTKENRDSLQIAATGIGNIIVDHCSFTWSVDEVASTWYAVSDVTISNCIIAEALSYAGHPETEHSKNLLIGALAQRITVYRSLIASSRDRNPWCQDRTSTILANCAMYNIDKNKIIQPGGTTYPSYYTDMTIVGCHSKTGPSSVTPYNFIDYPGTNPKRIYRNDNLYDSNLGDTSSDVGTPPIWHDTLNGQVIAASALQAELVARCGARPTDRDPHDTRILTEYANGTSAYGIIDSPSDVGGYTSMSNNPEAFTVPANPNSDDDGDGWTNIEELLFALSDALVGIGVEASPTSVTINVTGGQPTIVATDDNAIRPDGCVITVSGAQPTVEVTGSKTARPASGTIYVEGAQPVITTTTHVTIEPASGTIQVLGGEPWVGVEDAISKPQGAEVSVSGGQPAINSTAVVYTFPSGAVVNVTGSQPTVKVCRPLNLLTDTDASRVTPDRQLVKISPERVALVTTPQRELDVVTPERQIVNV